MTADEPTGQGAAGGLEAAEDVDALASAVVESLDPGTVIDDKVILSRRQLLAVAGSGLSAGALATLGVTESEAQSAVGQIGTDSDRVDVFADGVEAASLGTDSDRVDVWAASVNDGGVLSDGDGVNREFWLIANGASDPGGASAEDIIFEEN